MVRLLVFIKIILLSSLALSGCSMMKKESSDDRTSPGSQAQPSLAGLSVKNLKLFEKAVGDMQTEQYKLAVVALKKVSSIQPDLAAPYINLAISYRHLNDMKQAQAAVSQAIKNAPNSPEAHNLQGILHREKGLFKQARKSYEKSIKLNSNLAMSHLNLAILCDLYLQDLGCALDSYKNYQEKIRSEAGSEDKRLKGWIADLKRRMKKGKS